MCADDLCALSNDSDVAGDLESRRGPVHTLSSAEIKSLRDEVKEMFYSAYSGYMEYAYPADQLKPVTCKGAFFELTAGNMLTLIDSMDMLVILGDKAEFARAVKLVSEHANFEVNRTVSVFESTIRILGGLLSSHLFAKELLPTYDGRLLDLAVDLADRLLPAFDTPTSIPYGTVNLMTGVPAGETTEACTAGAGSLSLEFGMLSVLTGNATYGLKARSALKALFDLRSKLGLIGRHIDVVSGVWTEPTGGIGSNIDSIYEYYLKQYLLFGDDQAWEMFALLYKNVVARLRHEDTWYIEANIHLGGTARKVFNNLQAFWPGMQSTLGDVEAGSHTLNAFLNVWNDFGFTPEDFDFEKWRLLKGGSRRSYPLRPELAESTFYMHEATRDPTWLVAGRDMVRAIQNSCKTKCGFASIADVETRRQTDIMPSFFLSELCKYLFLLFDIENPFRAHNGGAYVFTTEAHPFKISAEVHRAAESLGFALPVTRSKRSKLADKDLWGVTSMHREMLAERQCAAVELAPWNQTKSEPYYRSENRRTYKRHLSHRIKKYRQKKQEEESTAGWQTTQPKNVAPGVFRLSSTDPSQPGEFEVHSRDGGFAVLHLKERSMVEVSRLGHEFVSVFVQTNRPSLGLWPASFHPQCHPLEQTLLGHSELHAQALGDTPAVLEDHTREHRYLFFQGLGGAFATECRLSLSIESAFSVSAKRSPLRPRFPEHIPCSPALFGPKLAHPLTVPPMEVVALPRPQSLGCRILDFHRQNSSGRGALDLQGKWVLLNRGGCSFERKTLFAQSVGARGVVVAAHRFEQLFVMNSMEPWERRQVADLLHSVKASTCRASPFWSTPMLQPPRIPTLLISMADGTLLRRMAAKGEPMKLTLNPNAPTHQSHSREPWAVLSQQKLVSEKYVLTGRPLKIIYPI